MNQSQLNRELQFGIRSMLLAIGLIAATVGGIYRETLAVGTATLFCLTTIVGVSIASFFSAADLLETFRTAYSKRLPSLFSTRVRWLILDTLTLVWAIMGVVVANYVFDNNQSAGPTWLLGAAVIAIPLTIWIMLAGRKTAV